MDKIGQISVHVLRKSSSINTLKLLQFLIVFHKNLRINVELNFAYNLLGFFKNFLKLAAKFFNFTRRFQNLTANSFEDFFKNPNNKLSAKFNSTLIPTISIKSIAKCKILDVLSCGLQTQPKMWPTGRTF